MSHEVRLSSNADYRLRGLVLTDPIGPPLVPVGGDPTVPDPSTPSTPWQPSGGGGLTLIDPLLNLLGSLPLLGTSGSGIKRW